MSKTQHPDLYPFAAYLALRFNVGRVTSIGLVSQDQWKYDTQRVRLETVPPFNARRARKTPVPVQTLRDSVLVLDDISEDHLRLVLPRLRNWLDDVPAAVITHSGAHTPESFNQWLTHEGLRVDFTGYTASGSYRAKTSVIAMLANNHIPAASSAPADYRVIALMSAYNEGDIIETTLQHLIRNGVDIYLIDNWSTDDTAEIARRYLGQGVIEVEFYPRDAALPYFDLRGLMARVEALAAELEADWLINYDVDELREPPWPDMSIRDALYHIAQRGFNCVDHTVIDFRPVDNGFVPGEDFGGYFRHYEWTNRPGYFTQLKAWRPTGEKVTLAETGGHRAEFNGRRIFPYKFLTRHYTFRSQAHGEQKVQEKIARAHPDERERLERKFAEIQAAPVFVWDRDAIKYFDPTTFYQHYLVERLSGVGLLRRSGVQWQTKIPLPLQRLLRSLRRLIGR